ncbi:hypothetical protein D8869_10040 [Streptococcus sanguinis]|uniref:DUF4947 domain-containing protein n=1 Tax=Streptococcus sanguinis TaxID=1305 RepID=A0AB74DNT4_STRSA|nr:DUF4947 domain-containing protein [Streptococcus sanguinis]RSI12762.1 hypothetical protein D8885_08725 [Streptococcus sanguinis]RSI51469.1 hypothetical protein D8869_10040 [Streptococcus sanguinis]
MKKRTLFSLFYLVAVLFLLSACRFLVPSNSESTTRPSNSDKSGKKVSLKDSSSSSKQSSKSKSSSSSSSSSSRSSSKENSSSSKDIEKTTDGLPEDADHAKKDKIYATGDAKVYYQSYESGGFEAQIPEFKGYTQEKVKSIFGEPEKVSTDLASEYEAFQNKELENLKRLVQEQKISTEQARAFLAGVVDISQASRLQNKYILYSYKNEQISIIFSQEGELLYVTPDPDYLYFK